MPADGGAELAGLAGLQRQLEYNQSILDRVQARTTSLKGQAAAIAGLDLATGSIVTAAALYAIETGRSFHPASIIIVGGVSLALVVSFGLAAWLLYPIERFRELPHSEELARDQAHLSEAKLIEEQLYWVRDVLQTNLDAYRQSRIVLRWSVALFALATIALALYGLGRLGSAA